MVLSPAYDQNVTFTSVGLKSWRHASTNAAIDHSWFFFTGNSSSSDRRMYLDAIIWQQKPDVVDLTHTKTIAKFILQSIYQNRQREQLNQFANKDPTIELTF